MNNFEWAGTFIRDRKTVRRKISSWDGGKESRGNVMTWTTGSSNRPNSADKGPILTQLICDEQVQTFRLTPLTRENSTSSHPTSADDNLKVPEWECFWTWAMYVSLITVVFKGQGSRLQLSCLKLIYYLPLIVILLSWIQGQCRVEFKYAKNAY